MSDFNSNVPGIYKIVNKTNGQCYIGSATNIQRRWYRHVNDLKKNKHPNQHLQHAWNKYGHESFEFLVLEVCPFNTNLIPREQHYITRLSPQYNIRKTAESNLGIKCSDATRKKLSIASKLALTVERLAKMLAVKAEKGQSFETNKKISISMMGRKKTPESIAKTVATKARNAVGKTPCKKSTKPLSPSHKNGISMQIKAYWSNGWCECNPKLVKARVKCPNCGKPG
jgi:group I intron endonuclease